jgi:hypothetical protein
MAENLQPYSKFMYEEDFCFYDRRFAADRMQQ